MSIVSSLVLFGWTSLTCSFHILLCIFFLPRRSSLVTRDSYLVESITLMAYAISCYPTVTERRFFLALSDEQAWRCKVRMVFYVW